MDSKRDEQVALEMFDSNPMFEHNLMVFKSEKNGLEPFNISYEKIFEGYERMKICTFSSSPNFFNKISRNYAETEVILGLLPKEDFADEVEEIRINKIEKNKRESLFCEIEEETRNKIINNKLNVYYANKGIVHDKFCILYGDNKVRLIIGSANLSEQAYNENIKQLEEIVIYDNDCSQNTLFIQEHEKRFDWIKNEICTPFFIKKQVENYKETGIVKAITVEEHQAELLQDFDDIPADILFVMKDKIQNSSNTNEEDIQYKTAISEIIKKSGNKKKNMFVKKESEFMKNIINSKITNVNIYANQNTIDIEKRSKLIIESSNNDKSLRYQKNEDDLSANITDYSYTKEELKNALDNVDEWINTYKQSPKYIKYPHFGHRILDIILTACSCVFFKEFRDYIFDNISQAEIVKIPMFVFITGEPYSGKTRILLFLKNLLGIEGDVIDCEKLLKTGGNDRYNKNLYNPMTSRNRIPILIDEIKPPRLSDENSGITPFIKSMSNNPDTSTTVFFTSNVKGFNMTDSAQRRCQIFMIENLFDEEKINVDYDGIIAKTTNSFSKIMWSKMFQHLKDDKLFTRTEHLNKDINYLYLSKMVLKEMYNECNYPLPDYYNDNLINDLDEHGKKIWHEFFQAYKKEIKRQKDTSKQNVLNINKKLFNSSEDRGKAYNMYLNYLPNSLIVSTEQQLFILIKEKEFFEWLGIKNPYSIF